jgi:tetraacyldisaccharide 4'-kinase
VNPLSALYGAAVATRNALYDRGVLEAKRLRWPVVSVGNLRVGGSGKTPLVIHLGELLKQRAVPFTVLSRGYGRKSTSVELVDPNGSLQRFGDEPLLIAQRLAVPVIVGADRHAAGSLAERRFGGLKPARGNGWIHVLDDGFQHRRLARDFDLVLLNESDLTDSLLPVGRLREPLSSLVRADAILIPDNLDPGRLAQAAHDKPIWRFKRSISLPQPRPRRPVAFCAIARPERFFTDLRAAGVDIAVKRVWRDHHIFTSADVRELQRLRDQSRADSFVTTAKDAIRLRGLPELKPLIIAELRIGMEDPEGIVNTILSSIAQHPAGATHAP